MSNKKDKNETKPLTKTLSDKMLNKYIQDSINIFDLRFVEIPFECEECGEDHEPTVIDEMFSPRFACSDWETYMSYDLPSHEEIKELLRDALEEKIEDFLDNSASDIEFFLNREKEHYPEFKAKRLERETNRAKLDKELTKEQWEAIYSVYPVVKNLNEHEEKHVAEKIKAETAKVDYELN